MSNALFGIPLVVSDMATTLQHRVERLPIKKRRKGYRVITRREPAVFFMNTNALGFGEMGGERFVMHPELAAKLVNLT